MHLNLNRRSLLAAATLLAAPLPRNSARAEAVQLHSPDTIVPANPAAAAPNLPLQTLAGSPTSLQAYLGKPVVLNFWATWCVPCVAELPELDRLATDPGLSVLAVSADHAGLAAVAPFLAKHPMAHATILLDSGADLAHAVQVFGFPTTLILDAHGQIRGRLEGPATWSTAGAVIRRLTK